MDSWCDIYIAFEIASQFFVHVVGEFGAINSSPVMDSVAADL
jgi:hypothetical protein